jgi:nitrate/TMAO reductase-like tetraheme cytochrome c subunit
MVLTHDSEATKGRRRAVRLLAGTALAAAVAIALAALLLAGPAPADDETVDTGAIIPPVGTLGPAPDPNLAKMFSDKQNCLKCHGDPSLTDLMTVNRPDGSPIVLYVDRTALANTVHRYKDCTDCHGTDPHDTKSALNKLSLSAKCGTCHEYEYSQYKDSVHGKAQSATNHDAATCTDCHSPTGSPHNIQRVLDPQSTIYPKNVAATCAKCHNNPKLMGQYGIVEKVYSSYMRSFHGKSIKLSAKDSSLEQLDTATCVSCHGAHDTHTISTGTGTAGSASGTDDLLDTCKSCHPTAGPEFVKGFLGHKDVNSTYQPVVYWGGKGFHYFSRFMLGFGWFTVATSLSLRSGSWVRRKLRRGKKKGEE